MRIDLPQCNLKTCRYSFDGNCVDKSRFDTCEYTYALAEKDNAKDELRHSYLKQHDLKNEYDKLKAENSLARDIINNLDKSNKEISDKWMVLNIENIELKAEIKQLKEDTDYYKEECCLVNHICDELKAEKH